MRAIGSKRIDKLTARDLDALYRKMLDAGLSRSRVRQTHAVLSRALTQAVKWQWLSQNVARFASPPSVQRTVVTAPSPEQLRDILLEASGRSAQMAALFALLAFTGARRGEIVALRWSDYDSRAGILTISKSVGYTAKNGIFVKSTKTNMTRRIETSTTMNTIVESQVSVLKKNADRGFDLASDPYLFYGDPGGFGPVHPDTPTKFFRIVCDQLGLPLHLHQLRHFVGTELIAAGHDPRTVAGRLGHDPAMLLRTYAHVVQARDRAASEYLETLIDFPRND